MQQKRVLLIEYTDKRWRLVAYLSKLLNEKEQNYKIPNKEMLIVIRWLEAWKHFLEGMKFNSEVYTNHKNLEYFMKA